MRRRGPPVSAGFDAQGQPTRAALAFAESCGAEVELGCERLDEVRATFLFFVGSRPGERAVDLLPAIAQAALDAAADAAAACAGEQVDAHFVRPVHWLVMLFGQDVVPATLLETPRRARHLRAPLPCRARRCASRARPPTSARCSSAAG